MKGARPTPLEFFEWGPFLALERTNVKKCRLRRAIITYFKSQFKNNSPAVGYYAIIPFSDNNMVNTETIVQINDVYAIVKYTILCTGETKMCKFTKN